MSFRFSQRYVVDRTSPAHRRRRPAGRKQAARFRPWLEQLEDRAVPVTVTWINAAGGAWDVASNWDTGTLPGPSDDAVIPDFPGAITITHATGTDTIRSLVSQEAIVLSGGSLTINAGGVSSTLNQSFTITGGTLALASTTLLGQGTLTNAATLIVTGSTLNLPLDNQGTVVVQLSSAFHGPLTTATGSTLNIQGTAAGDAGLTVTNGFTNNGAIQLSDGDPSAVHGAALVVSNGSLINAPGATISALPSVAGPPDGSRRLDAGLINQGTIQVLTGHLSINDSGGSISNSGAIDIAGGRTLSTAADFLQTGSVTIGDAGTFTASGPYTQTTGTLTGAGKLTVAGLLTWTGGTMSGSGQTVANGGLVLGGVLDKVLNERRLSNAGNATWAGSGSVVLGGGAVFANLAGATFDIQTDAAFLYDSGATPTVMNAGTLRKSASSSTTRIGDSVRFTNTGTVQVLANSTLFVQGAFTNFADTTLTGGAFVVAGTLKFTDADIRTNAATIVLDGPASAIVNQADADGLANFTTNAAAGSFTIQNGRNFTTTGPFSTAGTLSIAAGSTFTASGAYTQSAGTLTGAGNLTVTGLLTWTGGTMSGSGQTLAAGGLAIDGPLTKTLTGRTLSNAGNGTWTGTGTIAMNGGAIVNQAGALFDVQSDSSILSTGDAPVITNAGTFRKSSSSGTTLIGSSVLFNNTGTVEVLAGTLQLDGGGSSSGSFTVAAGAVLNFSSGTYTLQAGAGISGAGTVLLSGGTFVAATNITLPALNLGSSTLSGTGDVTVTGLLTWTGGTIGGSGQVLAAGGLTISGPLTKTLTGRTLINAGFGTWTDTGNILLNGGVFVNQAGALFDAQGSAAFVNGVGVVPVVANAGVLRKSAGTGTTRLGASVLFNHTGIVDVQTGTLALDGGGSSSGSFIVAAGATLSFGAGTYTLQSGSSFSGAGTVLLNGATLSAAVNVSLSNLTQTAGTLTGPGTVTVTSQLTWTDGTMSGSGQTVSSGSLILNSPTSTFLTDRTLSNAGAATWTGSGGFAMAGGAVFLNQAGALFDAQSDSSFASFGGGAPRIINAGTFRKSIGAGMTRLGLVIPFTNLGAVEVQTGALQLDGGSSGGSFTIAAGAALHFSSGTFTMQAGATISGAGTVVLNGATLSTDVNLSLPNLTLSSGSLSGTGSVAVAGLLTWTGGTMTGSGQTGALGGMVLSGESTKYLLGGRILHNVGLANWTDAGALYGGDGAIWNNLAGSVLDCQGDASLVWASGAQPMLLNAGTVRKSAGTGTTSLGGFFLVNAGSIVAQSGILSLGSGNSSSSGFVVAVGALLDFNGPSFTLQAGANISGSGSVMLSGGTLSTAASVTLSSLTQAGGTLAGTGTVIVTGLLTWTGGTMTGSGQTLSTGSLVIDGPLAKNLVGRTLSNAGSGAWTGTGNIVLYSGAVFANQASATFDIRGDAVFAFGSGATPAVTNAGIFRKSTGTGTTQLGLSVPFTNSGAVDVQTGALVLDGGGSSGGSFTVAAGAVLNFSFGTFTLQAGATLSGSGTVLLSGATLSAAGNVSLANLTQSGGTLTGAGSVTVTGPLTWTGGAMSGSGQTLANGSLILDGSADKVLTQRLLRNTANGTWTGTGHFVLGNSATFLNPPGAVFDARNDSAVVYSAGALPSVSNAGTFRKASGAGVTRLGTSIALLNTGAVVVQTGALQLEGGGSGSGSFVVAADAVLNFSASTYTMQTGATTSGPGTVLLSGATLSAAGNVSLASLTQSGGTLSGAGLVTVTGSLTWTGGAMSGMGQTQSLGTLTLSGAADKVLMQRYLRNFGSATWTGAGNIVGGSSAALVNHPGASFDIQNDAAFVYATSGSPVFANAGLVRKSAGSGTSRFGAFTALHNVGTLEVQSGTVFVEGWLTNFSGTTLAGGTFVIGAGTLKFFNADIRTNAAAIVLQGPSSAIVNQANGNALANFATNAAGGSFTIQDGRNFTTAGPFTNAGSVTIGNASTFTTTGRYTQTAGSITLSGGTLTASSGGATAIVDLQAGILAGSGTLHANLISAGQVNPGGTGAAGSLTIFGNYTQTTSGTLNIELGGLSAGSQYDRLSVSGTVQLDGTLNIGLINSFVPSVGDSFQVLLFGARSGAFASITGLNLGGGRFLDPVFDASSLTLITK